MSDLISRSELLKRFTFNSDGKRIPEYDVDNFPTTVSISTVKSMIREMPTASDLDKIIAELEEKRIEIKDKLLNSFDEGLANMLRGKLSQIADDIELIKTSLTPSEPPKKD